MSAPQTEVIITVAGTESGRRVLAPGDYVIGKGEDCPIQVKAERVSETHAKLIINYDHALIEDLGSPEGTRVNGQPVTGTARLWPNQKIEVGTAIIELHRLKTEVSAQSLAPTQAVVRRVLPEAFLREKKYDIGKLVAKGGMGAILDANEAAIKRHVAMKVMLDQNDADALLRFVTEAQLTGQLEHPNIVPVHELSVDENGQVFYTMKFVNGITLRKVLDALATEDAAAVGKWPLAALLTVFQKVCDAVGFAHSKGVLHRDLKPENIMLGDYGEVLVMDWGLAKRMRKARGAEREEAEAAAPEEEIRTIRHTVAREMPSTPGLDRGSIASTQAGAILGTPQYMSPEQARGEVETLDATADIYSLGAILYHILALRAPVSGKDAWEIVGKVARGEIEPLQGAGAPSPRVSGKTGRRRPSSLAIPESLAAVVRKAMSLDKSARYATVVELQRDITAYQAGFATGAENAGFVRQLVLLVNRHRGIFSTAAAAWLIITALAVWFVVNVTRERNRATANEQKATRNAEIAQENEKRAEAGEQEALDEKEKVRRALAKSALALAEAAYREADGPAMQSALDTVPADLRDANWSYLLEQSDSSIARLPSLGFSVRSVAAHPSLPSVFALSGEKPTVVVLNARTDERLLQFDVELKASGGRPLLIAFSPDGERIAVGQSGGADGRGGIAIHSARDGAKLIAWESTGVRALQFGPDGRRLLQLSGNAGDRRPSLTVWDATNGRQVWTFINTVQRLLGGFMVDGRQVLAAGRYGIPVVLNIEDGAKSRTVGIDVGAIDALAVRPDGLAFLWGDLRGNVHCADLKEGRLLFSNHAHPAGVQQIAFTPDGERFVSVASLPDGRQSIVVANARTGEPMQSLVGGVGPVRGIAIHPVSGELLISGPAGRVWDITGTAPSWSLPMERREFEVAAAAFWGSDDWFFGPAKANRTVLLNLHDLSAIWRPGSAISSKPSVSADGKIAAVDIPSVETGRALVVRRDEDKVVTLGDFEIHSNLRTFELSPTGDRIAIVTNTAGRPPVVLDSATGANVATLQWQSSMRLNTLRWLKDGAQLVGLGTAIQTRGIAKSEELIIVWDAASGRQVRSEVHPTALDCLVVAPDGKSFAAAGADKLVHVFDTETLAERQAFRAHDGAITALAWHPSRPILATGAADLTIKLWNLESGRRLETLRGPTAAPRVLNFSPSGQRLACASEDRMVRIWEPPSLNTATLDAPKSDGWEDLLGKLTTSEVKAKGNGWTLSGGVLVSSSNNFAALPLGGSYARSSYQMRVTLRSLAPKTFLALILPVADQRVGFYLDGYPKEGFATGLAMVDGKSGFELANSVRGQQVQDGEPHDLEITVQLSARTARITATLDERPLYEWSGPTTSLTLGKMWPPLPQPTLHLGASSADWVVSAVKVKRLDAGK